MGIEERWREPRLGVADVPPLLGRSERGVSRSLRNCALFMMDGGGVVNEVSGMSARHRENGQGR
jgi:hypothetical protein